MRWMMLVAALLAALAACESDGPWLVDSRYAERLVLEPRSSVAPAESLIETVDMIQIFRADDKVLPLNTLRHRDIAYETRDKSTVAELLKSTAQGSESGCEWHKAPVYHLIAYDSKLMRAAYIRVYMCSCKGQRMAVLRPRGDAGIFYSYGLPAFLLANHAKLE